MSADFRLIDAIPYAIDNPAPIAGKPPELRWIGIEKLVISPAYQRDIARRGGKNIRAIAASFDWSKFGTVVVAPVEGGFYAIVDGQHRVTAAAVRGIGRVPCQVIEATPSEQAAAFAAINGATTAITPLALHAALVEAGDPASVELNEICAAAGVTICRYPVPANLMKPGHTLAVGVLKKAHREFGREILGLALSCIMATRRPTGMVRAAVIAAICNVLDAEPEMVARPAVVIEAFRQVDLEHLLDECTAEAKRKKVAVKRQLAGEIFSLIDDLVGG